MRVSVVGLGYVGLNVAIGAANSGHTVIGLDSSQKNISDLQEGKTFVPGISQNVILELIKTGKFTPTSTIKSIDRSEVIVIAVPTPLDSEKKPDLSFLIEAAKNISSTLSIGALIVNESTSYPGTLRNLIMPIFESNSKVKFEFASAPERIDPGNNLWNLKNTPRIIAGITEASTDLAFNFYKTFCSEVIRVSTPEVAEASKLFENTFRQVNIALANEFGVISHEIGFSANEAIVAASTKPFGFMPFFPSIGVGGHCIPVDPSYLSYAAELAGSKAKFIDLANSTNLSMAEYAVRRIEEILGGSLKNKSVQVAGLAYKPDVSDIRESPSLLLIEELEAKGAKVTWCDPVVSEYRGVKSKQLNPDIDLGLLVVPHKTINFSIWRKGATNVLDLSASPNNFGWPKFF